MDALSEYLQILERLKTAPENERQRLLAQAQAISAKLPENMATEEKAVRPKVLTSAEEKLLADVRAMMLWPEVRENGEALRSLVKTARLIRGVGAFGKI